MPDRTPRVTIGVPVHNGERYLEATLASLLGQTFGDLEVVISDNASTDGTEAIARRHVACDSRVSYVRHDVNRGAAWNHNEVARRATAELFKWAAADDLCEPTFVARCVEALDADPTAVLALPAVVEIDDDGAELGPWHHPLALGHPRPEVRFRDLLRIGYQCYHVYGVVRRAALARTGLIGPFIESDMVTLAELALHGRFLDLDDPLFLHRLHPQRSVEVFPDRYDRAAWFDARKRNRLVFPTWRFLYEYLRAVQRAPLSAADTGRCLGEVAGWVWYAKRSFARDFKQTALRVSGRRPVPR